LQVRKWDGRMPSIPMAMWSGHAAAVTSISSWGDNVVTGGADSSVRLWDAQTGISIRCSGHGGPIATTSIAADYLLSAGWDGMLRCWFPAT
jgi:WD40 repeat protein